MKEEGEKECERGEGEERRTVFMSHTHTHTHTLSLSHSLSHSLTSSQVPFQPEQLMVREDGHFYHPAPAPFMIGLLSTKLAMAVSAHVDAEHQIFEWQGQRYAIKALGEEEYTRIAERQREKNVEEGQRRQV